MARVISARLVVVVSNPQSDHSVNIRILALPQLSDQPKDIKSLGLSLQKKHIPAPLINHNGIIMSVLPGAIGLVKRDKQIVNWSMVCKRELNRAT
jgi:hypothetical protein